MKKIIRYFLYCTYCLTLALLAGEGVARLFLPTPQVVSVQPALDLAARRADEETKVGLDIPTHPEEAGSRFFIMTMAGRRMRANTTALIRNHSWSGRQVEIETNSIGYRNREIGKKQGRRILFLGDSITLGAYIPEEETFVRRVERLAHEDGHNWETINSGIDGISLKNELSILHETGVATDPDVVVLGFYLNDFQESPGVFIQSMPWLVQHSILLFNLLGEFYVEGASYSQLNMNTSHFAQGLPFEKREKIRRSFESGLKAMGNNIEQWRARFAHTHQGQSEEERVFYSQVAQSFGDWGGTWSPEIWDEYLEPLMEELKRTADANGFTVLVLCFPVRDQVLAQGLYDEPQQRLSQITDDLDMEFLDLLPVLRAREEGPTLFYDHCHYTPLGNEIIAAVLYEKLLSMSGR